MPGNGGTGLEVLANWQGVVSALFVGLGAFGFYVSALISGRALHREASPATATLVSAGVGALLFALSPCGFFLIDYTLFGPANLVRGSLDDYLHRLLELAAYYLVSVVGVGLTFGAWSMLSARSGLLSWFRQMSGVRFGIQTYVLTWDSLLSEVKPDGPIHITTREQGTFTGRISSFSVSQEPRELALSDCVLGLPSLEEWIQAEEKRELLLTPGSDVQRIEVPSSSFKRHRDEMSHSAQALFIAISAFGLFLVASSCQRTAEFLDCSGYLSLGGLYQGIGLALVIGAGALVLDGFFVLRSDHLDHRAAQILAPLPFTLLAAALWLNVAMLCHLVIEKWWHGQVGSSVQFAIDGVLFASGVAWCELRWCRWRAIQRALLGARAFFRGEPELFDTLVDWVYLGFDLQKDPSQEWKRVRRDAPTALHKGPGAPNAAIRKLFRRVDAIGRLHHLRKQEYQLVSALRWMTAREARRGHFEWRR